MGVWTVGWIKQDIKDANAGSARNIYWTFYFGEFYRHNYKLINQESYLIMKIMVASLHPTGG